MTSAPPASAAPDTHEHEWRVASVENEPGGPVTELVCSTCPAVIYQ